MTSVKPGKASRFIRHLKAYQRKHPDLAVVLYLRVSSGAQDHCGNLDTYEWKLRRACRKLSIRVVVVFRDVISGWVLDENRDRLIAAVDYARQHEAETGVHTAVLAPCTDRFIRNRLYDCKRNPNVTPTEAEFRQLKALAGGVTLLTYLHPDMPLREVKRRQTRWGQQYKNRKGGGDRKPGWRNRRKAKWQSEARGLYQTLQSYREVAKRLGVSLRTAWKWVNELE